MQAILAVPPEKAEAIRAAAADRAQVPGPRIVFKFLFTSGASAR